MYIRIFVLIIFAFYTLICSILMAIVVYLSLHFFGLFFNLNKAIGIALQGGLAMFIGLLSYLLFSFLFKCEEPKDIYFAALNQFKKER